MSDTNKESTGKLKLVEGDNLLDHALSQLTEDQRQQVLEKAVEKKIELDAESKKADLRYQASTADMANTIRQVDALEKSTQSDYKVKAEYETASGKTNIEVKKSNNTVIIVIAIVIGIILLLMFAN